MEASPLRKLLLGLLVVAALVVLSATLFPREPGSVPLPVVDALPPPSGSAPVEPEDAPLGRGRVPMRSEQSGLLHVRVTDARSGVPLPGASVTLRSHGLVRSAASTPGVLRLGRELGRECIQGSSATEVPAGEAPAGADGARCILPCTALSRRLRPRRRVRTGDRISRGALAARSGHHSRRRGRADAGRDGPLSDRRGSSRGRAPGGAGRVGQGAQSSPSTAAPARTGRGQRHPARWRRCRSKHPLHLQSGRELGARLRRDPPAPTSREPDPGRACTPRAAG